MVRDDESLSSVNIRSNSLVSNIVRHYNSVHRQTLADLQAELRSSQQTIVADIDSLNKRLAAFNDSTAIGDDFVR